MPAIRIYLLQHCHGFNSRQLRTASIHAVLAVVRTATTILPLVPTLTSQVECGCVVLSNNQDEHMQVSAQLSCYGRPCEHTQTFWLHPLLWCPACFVCLTYICCVSACFTRYALSATQKLCKALLLMFTGSTLFGHHGPHPLCWQW